MRHHPFFYCLVCILMAQRICGIESSLSGEWLDFSTFELKAEMQAMSADDSLSIRGVFFDRRSNGEEERLFCGAELKDTGNASFYAGAGPLAWKGLLYSLANPFGKAFFSGARFLPSAVALTGTPSSATPFSCAVSIGLPADAPAWVRAASLFDSNGRETAVAGAGFGSDVSVMLETAFSQGKLEPRTADTWFSDNPPLPAREHRLGAVALTTIFGTSQCFIAGAFSDTEAQGKGVYAKTVLDLTFGRFRLSTGAEASSGSFIDIAGLQTGQQSRGIMHLRGIGEGGNSILLRAEGSIQGAIGPSTEMKLDMTYRPATSDARSGGRCIEIFAEGSRASFPDEESSYRFKTSGKVGFERLIAQAAASVQIQETGIREGCAVSAKIDFPVKDINFSVSAGLNADAYWKILWSASAGAAVRIRNGLLLFRAGTDGPASWERLSGTTPSASPLGPWSFSVLWRFRERF